MDRRNIKLQLLKIMNKQFFLVLVTPFLLLSACSKSQTTLHLPERNETFRVFNYQINDSCISFNREPKSTVGETICNENFWIENKNITD